MKEFERYNRVGTTPHRSYYIPFSEGDKIKERCGIIDRTASSRFLSLDGEWQIKQHAHIEDFLLDEPLFETIPVPSCVQMHGYDQIQYLNTRYPIPVMPPHVPYENPSWHYRRTFDIKRREGEKYYINFEGVDSAFYLYVNGKAAGYSQISHATSEFDITDKIIEGENTVDVHVLKWCASTYLECQDKFRFSGIFRSVYILSRPEDHITDYKIETALSDIGGSLVFINESPVDIELSLLDKSVSAPVGQRVEIEAAGIAPWSDITPNLYELHIRANGEHIIERVGFREVRIDGKVFKINGAPVKLKGVNRHDFNPKTAATVTLNDMYVDVRLMKELNVNAVRTSHYPNSPEFYQLCDANGIYVMDEADLETHGAAVIDGTYSERRWRDYAEWELFAPGIKDRHIALVERDKNRSSVIIWSLGNESSFGKAFFEGAAFIKHRDSTRPVHYEGIIRADEQYYFTEYVDMFSMMYPSFDTMRERALDNPEETRPFVLCEYTHAMGNSCGDIADYWNIIYSNEQMVGAFVWEWADHAVLTEKGLLYGGDFGEREHDGNFCVDGLVTADRKLKSGAVEMRAVYGGKTSSEIKDVLIPEIKRSASSLSIEVDEHTGSLTSIKRDGVEVLKAPTRLNLVRYIDNDMKLAPVWFGKYHLDECKPQISSAEKTERGYKITGVLAANCLSPAVEFTAEYSVKGNELECTYEYRMADYVSSLPRFGVEITLDKAYSSFSYIGYGPYESYSDKHVASEYGYYESCAEDSYDKNYLRPQESGSHFATKYLSVNGLFTVTADEPFSFSLTPYNAKQLYETKHSWELTDNGTVTLSLDLAMRGVGSSSCGPALLSKYEVPRSAKNIFKIVF